MTKYSKDENISYALGTTLTIELLKRKIDVVRKVYISPKQKRDDTYAKVIDLCKKSPKIQIIENNERIFRDLSGKDNTMVIGEFEKFKSPLNKNANHVVLVNPSNMGNLGTIIRSTIGFNLSDIAIITPAADIFDPKVVRASMGAIFNLNFELFSSFEEYMKAMGGERHPYPFMLQAKVDLKNVEIKYPYSLVFGNEATGLDRSFLEVGTPILIPHSPLIDSLNLDNAVAIGIYWFTK